MKALTGQMDIFQFLTEQSPDIQTEPPILIHSGERVFHVIKGDIFENIVKDDHSFLCSNNTDRGYVLQTIGRCYGSRSYDYHLIPYAGCYDVCHNSTIGKAYFLNKSDADTKANSFLSNMTEPAISPWKLFPKKTLCYKLPSSDTTYFYSIFDNDLVYVKAPMLFQHMIRFSKKFTEKKLEESIPKNAEKVVGYEPTYVRMYPCNYGGWCYAEANFTGH